MRLRVSATRVSVAEAALPPELAARRWKKSARSEPRGRAHNPTLCMVPERGVPGDERREGAGPEEHLTEGRNSTHQA